MKTQDDPMKKVPMGAFDLMYWGAEFDVVPEDVRKVYYENYLASPLGTEDYVTRPTHK